MRKKETFCESVVSALFQPEYGDDEIVRPTIFCALWVTGITTLLFGTVSLLSGIT